MALQNIWSLDLSTMTGVAQGYPPEPMKRVNSFTVEIRKHGILTNPVEDATRCQQSLEQWFHQSLKFKDAKPDLITYEAPMDVQWASQGNQQRNTFALLIGPFLASSVIRMCELYKIEWKQVSASTVRTTFIGRSKRGKGEPEGQIKKDVLAKCKEWGYLPPTANVSRHNNQADALALWHYSQVAFAQWQPPFEHMFGKMVPVVGGVAKVWPEIEP